MRYSEKDLLLAEIGTVEGFLETLSEDDFIERLGWEDRLEELQERLSVLLESPPTHPLFLTFSGDPVEGSESIEAGFVGQAMNAFVKATQAVTAEVVHGGVGHRGKLRGSNERQLRIVGTAVGSFGFELELPAPEPKEEEEELQTRLLEDEQENPTTPSSEDLHVTAIQTTLRLLEAAAQNNDDTLSDLVMEIHPRVASEVRSFAKVLKEHKALCSLEFEGTEVRFDDHDQIQTIVDVLDSSEISEEHPVLPGVLTGVLPVSRRFEARLDRGDVIQGEVDADIEDIEEFKRNWEGQSSILELHVIRFRTRARWTLVGALPYDEFYSIDQELNQLYAFDEDDE
jgi:hypothetical protein